MEPPIGGTTLWETIKKRQNRLRHDGVVYGEQGAEWALALTEELERIHSQLHELELIIKRHLTSHVEEKLLANDHGSCPDPKEPK